MNENWLSGNYNVTVNGFDFIVDGKYTSGEKPIRYYKGGGGYPGSPSKFEISSVIGFGDNDKKYTIWDYNDMKKLKTIEERRKYDNVSHELLNKNYRVTFNDLTIATIKNIEEN